MNLIIYFSKTNTTKKAAYLLADKLENCEIIDGNKIDKIDFHQYDSIIIGTYIRMNKPNNKFLKLIKKIKRSNYKNYNCFIVSANKYKKNEYITNLNKYFSENSLIDYFGGELNVEESKGLTKILIEACIKDFYDKNLELPSLDLLEIEEYAYKIKNGLI